MGASALESAGLESAFHGALPGWSTSGRNDPLFKRPAILEKAARQVNFRASDRDRKIIKEKFLEERLVEADGIKATIICG